MAVAVLVVVVFAFTSLFHFQNPKNMPYRDTIAKMAAEYDLDPYLVAAVIQAESGGDPNASSGAGAVGLMQVTDIAAEEMVNKEYVTGMAAVTRNLLDPETNIRYGCAVLAWLSDQYDSNETVVLAAYNAGPSNADRWIEAAGSEDITAVIDLPETLAYVNKVEAIKSKMKDRYPNAFN